MTRSPDRRRHFSHLTLLTRHSDYGGRGTRGRGTAARLASAPKVEHGRARLAATKPRMAFAERDMGVIPLSDASRRPSRFPIVTASIIAVNAFVFVLELFGGQAFVSRWSLVPADIVGGHN